MLASVDDVDAAGQTLGRIADTLSLEVIYAIVLAVAVGSLRADDQLANGRQLCLLLHAVDRDCGLRAVVGLEPAREAAETAHLFRVLGIIYVAIVEEVASHQVVVAIADCALAGEAPFARRPVLFSILVEGADEGAVGRDGSHVIGHLRPPMLVHVAEVVLIACVRLERDAGDLEALSLDRYVIGILRASILGDGGGVGAIIVVLHRLDREDDVRLVSLESDILVGFSVEVYGLKLQLGGREVIESGKAHGGTKGIAKLLNRKIYGQHEGVPFVRSERLGKAEHTVLVGNAILQILQVATKFVENEVLILRVAYVDQTEVVEYSPFVEVGSLAAIANVETEGDADTLCTSLVNHILRHLYDHAIGIFA